MGYIFKTGDYDQHSRFKSKIGIGLGMSGSLMHIVSRPKLEYDWITPSTYKVYKRLRFSNAYCQKEQMLGHFGGTEKVAYEEVRCDTQ